MAKDRLPLLIGLTVGAVALLATRKTSRVAGTTSTRTTGTSNPIWPLAYDTDAHVPTSGGLSLGAKRPARGAQTRYHAGVDLKAKAGTPVMATESGTVVGIQGWAGDDAKALLVETDSGVVVNYGAVAPNSWKEFGVSNGSRVTAGQGIARVGMYPNGGQMLHFELYTAGTDRNAKWKLGKPPPENLIDPVGYLQRASRRVIA